MFHEPKRVATGSKWATTTCLSIMNGPGSFLEKCLFDPFLTHCWSQNGPFSRNFGIFHGPKLRRFGRAPPDLAPPPRAATGEFVGQNLDLASAPPVASLQPYWITIPTQTLKHRKGETGIEPLVSTCLLRSKVVISTKLTSLCISQFPYRRLLRSSTSHGPRHPLQQVGHQQPSISAPWRGRALSAVTHWLTSRWRCTKLRQ